MWKEVKQRKTGEEGGGAEDGISDGIMVNKKKEGLWTQNIHEMARF